jgi:hypothetical protein
MRVSVESAPGENFTIAVSGEGGTDELVIQWDRFVWRVPVKAN